MKVILLLIVFVINAMGLAAQTEIKSKHPKTVVDTIYKPPPLTPIQELQSDLDALTSNTDFSNALIGISVLSMESGEYFYRKNDTRNFIPASSLKLFTGAAALKILGPEYRFSTALYLDGSLKKNGEFLGNIIVRGSGDPTLSPSFDQEPFEVLDNWASALDSLGIRSIRGNIIGDDTYMDNVYYGPGWAWDDMAYPFSAQVNALSINDNKIDILVKPAKKVGDPAHIYISPDNTFVRVINNLVTVSHNDYTDIAPIREARSNIIELNGFVAYDSTFQSTHTLSVTVDNPTLFFLNIFKEAIENRKIRFRGALIDSDDWNDDLDYRDMLLVHEHLSPPLSEIIAIINKYSHNLAAELLFKTIAAQQTGEGSYHKARDQMKHFCGKIGISPENISITDGSGLSRFNLMSPKYQVALLSYMYRSEFSEIFIASLAEPGKNGTLQRRMTRSRAEKNVVAKTGSMNNISSICGYITTRDNEKLAFAVFIMNYTVPASLAHNLEDLICMRLASFSRK